MVQIVGQNRSWRLTGLIPKNVVSEDPNNHTVVPA
jgi:hypothetical protein